MKRIHLLEVCLVIMMALGAVAMASTASAGEYFNCQEVIKKTGKYGDNKCTILKEKNGKPAGNFEKLSVSPCVKVGKKKGKFSDAACTKLDEEKGKPAGEFETCFNAGKCKYSSTGGEATLSTPAFGKNNVTCKANTDLGEITGNFTDTDRVVFTGCEFLGLPCQSAGPNSTPSGKPGVIITNVLDSKLVDFPEKYVVVNQKFEPEEIGPVEGEVWDKLVSSEHEPFSSEFECGGVVFLRTQGSDAGAYTKASLNHLSETAEVNFEDTHGQGLMTEALNEKGEWVPPGGAPSLEEAGTAKITNSNEIEVRGGGGKGPKVKVAPKAENYKKVKVNTAKAAVFTYTNEGPGGWDPKEFKFFPVEGEVVKDVAFKVKLGAKPCNKIVPVGQLCEEVVEIEPKKKEKYKANLTTNEASETAVVEGEGE
jgi:hypothetical protein